MRILIVGATGATGRLLTEQILIAGHSVKAIVRSRQKLAPIQEKYSEFQQIEGTVLEMTDDEIQNHIRDCDSIVSCLGHNISFKGLYGKPRRLVRDILFRLVTNVEPIKPENKMKIVLMNTTGNPNKDLNEKYPLKERIILNLLYALLPPHTDNIEAADFLRVTIGQNHPNIEWVIVRPDTLFDEDSVTDYDIEERTRGGAIFLEEKTSRINTANVMMRLLIENELWATWRGKMPVVYNK